MVISDATAGSSLRYTTDGSTPTAAAGTLIPPATASRTPSATIQLPVGSATLKAIGFKKRVDGLGSAKRHLHHLCFSYANSDGNPDSDSNAHTDTDTNTGGDSGRADESRGGRGFLDSSRFVLDR